MDSALDKARDQRARFIETLRRHGDQIVFDSKKDEQFEVRQFRSSRFISIAQGGATKFGFDAELDFTLHELMQLRMKLLHCQNRGECPVL